ncbi:uncharacterized protein [Haliotis cracherodii]|uniref:uncharacterized protein n=1 Tax=Haliotis cracherodii TaxID=6455 RepID=UPI0039EC01A3
MFDCSTNKRTFVFGSASFISWAVTSFLCHQSTYMFLGTSGKFLGYGLDGFIWAIIITLCQVTMCYLLTDVHLWDPRSTKAKKILWVKVACHVLATMATNYSMTLVHASSTFAIKLLEPVTSAIIQRLVLGTSLPPTIYVTLPLIIGGAVGFCGNSFNTSLTAAGVAMAFTSNIILAFRNVAIKLEQKDTSTQHVHLRPKILVFSIAGVCVTLVVGTKYLASQKTMSTTFSFLVKTALCSSVFHVIYSYISTNVVLLYMSVVSHSVANIFKRILVVLLLYSVGQREATLANFSGLGICSLGLIIYVLNKKGNTYSSIFHTPSKIIRTRILGLCFLCFCFITVRYNDVNTNNAIGDVYRYFIPGRIARSSNLLGKSFEGKPFSKYIQDFSTNALSINTSSVEYFLKRKLILSPKETDILSPSLTSSLDIIREAQRVHFNLFSDMLSPYKQAILLDIASFENKGDPAITTGEVYLLRRLGIKLLYYCNYYACTDKNLDYAKNLTTRYSHNDLVVLIHGGGNLVGYSANDKLRDKIFQRFSNFKMVLFPQSIFLNKNSKKQHLEFCKKLYQNQGNFTMVLRDRQSLGYAETYFRGKPILMMAPDMAFQIGAVPRFISPSFDILWLKRSDGESPGYKLPKLPLGITVHCSDWWGWKTPKGHTTMETAFLMANNGLIFLQRGRVVITDRLHGHILSTLLDIPHVLIDNSYRKLSSYHNTWTRGLANTVIADNASHALELAVQLLQKYGDVLPPIAPYMDVVEQRTP